MKETDVQEILDNQRGHRVITTGEDGEVQILRRARNGIQVTFPDRPVRAPIDLGAARQQGKLGITG